MEEVVLHQQASGAGKERTIDREERTVDREERTVDREERTVDREGRTVLGGKNCGL